MNRFSKVLVVLGALLIWYALFGFLIAPALIRHFGEKTLQENFSPESAIAKVRINPFSGSFRVEGLALEDSEGAWSVACDLAEVDLGAATFVKFYPVLDVIRLVGADIRYEKRPGEEEVVEVVEKEEASDWREVVNELNLAEIPELRVDLLEVSAGRVEFVDRTNLETYAKTLDPINFTLRDLTTVAEKDSEMSFVAETDRGARLSWEGNFQSQPIRSAGSFSLDGLAVHDLSPYFDQFIRFDLQQAFFGLSFDYALNFADLDNLFRIQEGRVSLAEVRCEVTDASDRVIAVDSIIADGLDFGFPQMELGVASVRISDGETRIFRDAGGEINLSRLVALPPKLEDEDDVAVPEDPAEGALPPFTFQIDEIVFSNYSVTWEEALDASRANLSVVVPRMQIADLNSDAATPFALVAEYRIGETGQVQIDGTVLSDGPVLDLEIVIDALPLDVLSPYAQSYGDTSIASGQLGFSGRLQYAAEGAQTLVGSLSINEIDMVYSENLEASWTSLQLDGLNLNLAPFSLGLEAVSLEKPQLVYRQLASEPEAELPDASAESEPAKGQSASTPVRIDQIEISEGHITFNDQSIEPSPKIVMDAFTLNVSDLDLGGNAPASIGLSTQVNGSSLQVDGLLNVNDLKEATQFKATLSGLALPAFSAYSGQAVGRVIDSGRFNLESDWSIEGKQLKASNKIRIERLAFGDSVESESAVSLPLDLAVMMLQGPSGVMDLSLPLSGDLSDPKVGIWQIVRTAAVGLITNVAAAPFKMLSGLVGSSDEDLSFVSFSAGSAELEPAMLERLNTLARALKERPGLKLVLTPEVAEADKIELSKNKLKADLLGDADLDDEKLYLKRLTKRYEETMKEAGTPDKETKATDVAGFEKMLAALLPDVELSSEDFVILASARSAAIRDHLSLAEGVATERLIDKDPVTDANESAVRFDLK